MSTDFHLHRQRAESTPLDSSDFQHTQPYYNQSDDNSKASRLFKSPILSLLLVMFIIVLLIIVSGLAISLARRPKSNNAIVDNSQFIELITYNDVYQLKMVDTEYGEKRGGPSRVARYIKDLKRQRKFPNHVLVLSAGDMLSPSSMSTLFSGEQMVRANNLIGLNFSALGNHEFDFGVETLGKRVKESQFTWLNSNIKQLPFDTLESTVVKIGPAHIGLFGVLYDFGPSDASFNIENVIEASKTQVASLKQKGAQYIIALTHQNSADDCLLSNAVPEIDLIVGGHDHRSQTNMDCGHAMYVKATQDWINIWHIKIDFSFNSPLVAFSNIAITPDMPPDAQMEKLIKEYDDKAGEEFKTVIGTTSVTLDGREFSLRTSETNLGNYIGDALRKWHDSDISLTNGGGIRGNKYLEAGSKITKGDLFDIFPFANDIVVVSVNGSVLAQAMEHALSGIEHVAGRFPVISGFSITYVPSDPVGSRLKSMKRVVDGQPVDITPDMVMSLATSSFLHGGGDQYHMLKDLPTLIDPDAQISLLKVLMEAIVKDGVLAPTIDGRVKKI